MLFFNDLKFLIPEIFLIIAMLCIFLYGSIISNATYYKYVNVNKPIICLIILVLLMYIYLLVNSVVCNFIIADFLFVSNKLILFLKIYFVILIILILLVAYWYTFYKQIYQFEFYIIILFITVSIIFVLMSFDFIAAFLSIELQTLCFYILIGISKTNKTLEASIKYYILGSFSTAIFIFGIAFIYYSTGMTNFKDLADLLVLPYNTGMSYFTMIGFIFITIAFFFKLSLAPFHFWLVDIFDGSVRIVLAIFANLAKLSILFLFYRIHTMCLIQMQYEWEWYLLGVVILSWTVGSVGGLMAKKIDKLIAYSSINHMGFFLFGIILNSFQGLFVYFFFYSINLLFLFIFLMSLWQKNNNEELYNLNQFTYFKKINYIGSIALTVCFFSLSGIPPLTGFFGKFVLILWSVTQSYYLLSILALVMSLISCFYYIRVIKIMNFNNNNKWLFLAKIPAINCVIIICCVFFNVFFIVCFPFINALGEFFYLSL